MKANGQYEKGDRMKRGNADVLVEADETDEEFEARKGGPVEKNRPNFNTAVINGETVSISDPKQPAQPAQPAQEKAEQ